MRVNLYIAYGSNLNQAQMKQRCPGATPAGTGYIEGWRLAFRGSKTGSYLTIEPEQGARTPVALWTISEKNEERLDRYEGFPFFYYKKFLPVELEDGATVWGFAYIMHEDRPHGVPSEAYNDTCRQGYLDFRLDRRVLEKAILEAGARAEKDRRETE